MYKWFRLFFMLASILMLAANPLFPIFFGPLSFAAKIVAFAIPSSIFLGIKIADLFSLGKIEKIKIPVTTWGIVSFAIAGTSIALIGLVLFSPLLSPIAPFIPFLVFGLSTIGNALSPVLIYFGITKEQREKTDPIKQITSFAFGGDYPNPIGAGAKNGPSTPFKYFSIATGRFGLGATAGFLVGSLMTLLHELHPGVIESVGFLSGLIFPVFIPLVVCSINP